MIKVGIIGYGEVGKGVESALRRNPDTVLKAIFTNRDVKSLGADKKDIRVYPYAALRNYENEIDVMINCGRSSDTLPVTTPETARRFNVVDSYDIHASVREHMERVNRASVEGGKVSIVSVGWDPGIFSLERLYTSSAVPHGSCFTFWGKGVSRGHTSALKKVEGVADAVQYTVPSNKALQDAEEGRTLSFSEKEMHIRECFVVPDVGADKEKITAEIKNMPDYFAGYDTRIHFVTGKELKEKYSCTSHGGCVIGYGTTGENSPCKIKYSLSLGSNAEFTGNVLVCYARAAYRLHKRGETGCRCALDIPPILLSPLSRDETIERYL